MASRTRVPPLPPGVTEPVADPVQARAQPRAVAHARRVWSEWWTSPFSTRSEYNSEALSWWIICVFRRSLYIQVVREQPLVKGSRGDVMTNPLETTMHKLTEEIARAEFRIGMLSARRNYEPGSGDEGARP